MAASETTSLVLEEEVIGWFGELSNWGRWGLEDELGTLNHLSRDATRAAAQSVSEGRVVACSHRITPATNHPGEPVLHMMMSAGDAAPAEGPGSTTDWLGIGCHGTAVTHLDAHSHLVWNRKIYNGRDSSTVSARGALHGSVETAAAGIAGRGVLADIARHRGEAVGAGEAVSVHELAACLDEQRVEPASGDVLLVRFGRDLLAESLHFDGDAALPGLAADCLPWLHRNNIAVLATVFVSDALPSPYPHVGLPVHTVGIVAMGLWILDNAALGPLSIACTEADRWSFFVSIAALRIARATGSPVNPIAVL
jgi:kynurenine formamidase